MGFLNDMLAKTGQAMRKYGGDQTFLLAAASASANVTAADGTIEDSEIDAAIQGMMANPILAHSYSPSKIEEEVNNALLRAKTRAGRMQNLRFIEGMTSRPVELRQDIFLIAADVTAGNSKGLGEPEHKVLEAIAKSLNVNKTALLA